MRTLFILLTTVILLTPNTKAQENVEISIQLITPEVLGQVNLDMQELVLWIKKTNETIESYFSDSKDDFDMMAIVNFNPKGNKEISLHFRAVKNVYDKGNKLLNMISEPPMPKTKISDYSMAIMAQVNEGGKEDNLFEPEVILPVERKLMAFEKMSLSEQYEDIQRMASQEIIPIIGHFLSDVDPQFAGVLALGELINSSDLLEKTSEEITSHNADFWRATMEMHQRNQLIPFTKVAVHMAKGEIDQAKNLMQILSFFSDDQSLPEAFNEEVVGKLDIYDRGLSAEINKGIALHDKGKYDEAVNIYEELLGRFNGSAWLNYELYLSKSAGFENTDELNDIWSKHKDNIYSNDPMYSTYAQANSKESGFEMWRRMELKELFGAREKLIDDLVEYADIALDLKNYDIAGQVYWMILSNIPPENYGDRDLLAYYLYCMSQLGHENILDNFKEESKEGIDDVAKEREEFKQNHFGYKTMKD